MLSGDPKILSRPNERPALCGYERALFVNNGLGQTKKCTLTRPHQMHTHHSLRTTRSLPHRVGGPHANAHSWYMLKLPCGWMPCQAMARLSEAHTLNSPFLKSTSQ